MNQALTINDEETHALRQQLAEQKKLAEYRRLKEDLFKITLAANHQLSEFDSGMKEVDTERRLVLPKGQKTFSQLLISRFLHMCSLRPISGNCIALSLALAALLVLQLALTSAEMVTLKKFLSGFIELAAAVQILKSASRSLILPLVSTLLGAIVVNQMAASQMFLGQSLVVYQGLLITGLIGMALSVFSID